ncbi:DUF3826 domain-containing protein, partial [Alistipes sp. OttesenSCG-928-L06]|nr:DUF3826 domain-containing protein [Alistipes sp. OttesenSCG-928-L06]
MKKSILFFTVFCLLSLTGLRAQESPERREAANQQIREKAAAWVAELNLNDAAKAGRVAEVIAVHQIAVRDFHNEHPASLVPDGINPRTGDKLNNVEKQVFINSTKPASVHDNLMSGLRADLTEEQVEHILDKYTAGKVEFTMRGYRECIPDLTAEEEAGLYEILKKLREMAVDFKNMNMISQIFEIGKTKCELFLYQHDRNFKRLYKEWVDRLKA